MEEKNEPSYQFRRKASRHVAVNTSIFNYKLSAKAVGIWLYASTRPEGWQFYEKDIVNHFREGREAIRTGLKELEEIGLLVKDKQEILEDGKFGKRQWFFFDEPVSPEEIQKMFPKTGFPTSENPSTYIYPFPYRKEKENKKEKYKKEKPRLPKRAGGDPPLPPPQSSHSVGLVRFFFEKIKQNSPKAKAPDEAKWAAELERMHKSDGWSYDEIRAMIEYATADDFWKGNILSPSKLRKQAVQLDIKMRTANKPDPEKAKAEIFEANKALAAKMLNGKSKLSLNGNYVKIEEMGIGYCYLGRYGVLGYLEKGFEQQLKNIIEKLQN